MSTKRVYYETEEVVRKTKRGYIELHMDYFQFYNNAFPYVASLSSNCAKDFIIWIMARVNDENEFTYSKVLFNEFLLALQNIPNPKTFSENTLHVALRELVDTGVLIKMGRARYKVNPKLFWSEGTSKRIKTIQQLESNSKVDLSLSQGTPLPEPEEVIENNNIIPTEEEKDVPVEVIVDSGFMDSENPFDI